jgi:K+-sensing histidine kinase KdpD
MYEAAECMAAAMDELTDTARLQSGHPLVLQLGLVDLGALVSGVAHALNETRTWCRVAPITVLGSPAVVLVGDRTRLQRVLRTVLDYVAARSRAEAPVQVTVRPHGDAVTIAVQEGDGPSSAQEQGLWGRPRAQAHGPGAGQRAPHCGAAWGAHQARAGTRLGRASHAGHHQPAPHPRVA